MQADQYIHNMHMSDKELKTDLGIIQKQLLRTDEAEIKSPYFMDLTRLDYSQVKEPPKLIEFILVVGFHHKIGSQIEYIYPPL